MIREMKYGIAVVMLVLVLAGGASAADSDSFRLPLDVAWDVSRGFGVWVNNWDGEGSSGYHLAEDVPASQYTPVYAASSGVVKYTNTNIGGYGSVIIIEHPSINVTTLYGHLSRYKGLQVATGESVVKGQLIGYVGNDSENGGWVPHIHFGIRKGLYSTKSLCGHWLYVGYSLSCAGVTNEQYRDMWYNSSDFVNSHQGASILDQSIYPTTAAPGDELTFVYNISNPYPYSIGNVRLGAQIRTNNPQGAWIDDPGNDKVVTLLPGAHDYSRKFIIPQSAVSGFYDARWVILNHTTGIWIDSKNMTRIFEIRSSTNVVLGKPVSVTTNGAEENHVGSGQWTSDITDGSLDYIPASWQQEDGVIGYVNDDYNQLMIININIDLQGTYRITKIRYNMGNVQRAETWNADIMESPFGRISTNPGSPYSGVWTEQTGDLTASNINIRFEKTRTAWARDWLFIGEIEIYGMSAPTFGSVHNINKGTHYTTIQAAINDASPGDEIRVDSGTYHENVNVSKPLVLRGIDNGGGQPIVVADERVIFITVDGVTIEGFNTRNSAEKYAGIFVVSNNNIIKNNTASYTLFNEKESYGIALEHSNNNTIYNNNASNTSAGIIMASSSNNTILNNNFANNVIGIMDEGSIYNNIITRNNISSRHIGMLLKGPSSNNIISYNTFINGGMVVVGSYQNVVVNNIVNGKPLVYLENVSDQTITDAGQIILVNSNNITAKNLILSNATLGIELLRTNNSKILSNSISNNTIGGIVISNSNNNILKSNVIFSNQFGIDIADYSINNNIYENNIINNILGIGFELPGNNNNTIYHNNFINNTYQVTQSSINYNITNQWNSGYPSGGNYWSDYTGADIKSGPSQNIPGSDGIGDTPYNISGDAGAQDRYPFMKINDWQSSITTTPTATPISGAKGDVSGDGQITVVDALFVAQYTVGLRTLTSTQLASADVNGDGQVTVVDALFIAQYTVGLRQL